MFVVRLVAEGKVDTKHFERKSDAETQFYGGWELIAGCDGAGAVLYYVPEAQSLAEAITAFNQGRSDILILEQLPPNIDVDLEKLGL